MRDQLETALAEPDADLIVAYQTFGDQISAKQRLEVNAIDRATGEVATSFGLAEVSIRQPLSIGIAP